MTQFKPGDAVELRIAAGWVPARIESVHPSGNHIELFYYGGRVLVAGVDSYIRPRDPALHGKDRPDE